MELENKEEWDFKDNSCISGSNFLASRGQTRIFLVSILLRSLDVLFLEILASGQWQSWATHPSDALPWRRHYL